MLDISSFTPTGNGYAWRSDVLWLHVISDLIIGISFCSIPIAIFYFLKRRKDIEFKNLYTSFIIFIFASGVTHLFSVYTTWVPRYFTEGFLKGFTALASAGSAILLWKCMPILLEIPSLKKYREKTELLESINADLESEVKSRVGDSLFLASLVESSTDAIFSRDIEGHITEWNPAAENIFGYTRDEVMGKSSYELLAPDGKSYQDHPIIQALLAGKRVPTFDTKFKAKSGRLVDVALTLSPIFSRCDKKREVIGISVFTRDITERKQNEEQLKNLNNRLTKRTEEVEQFIYTISHDLKSPLVTFQGFLGYLVEDFEAGNYEDAKESLGRLISANKRLTEIIDDLLEIGKIGQLKSHFETVDSNVLIKELIDDIFLEGDSSKIKLNVDSKTLPELTCDRQKLKQALENLIRNASAYGRDPDGKLILDIFAEETEDEVIFSIRDHGKGIEADYKHLIFELFQRLDTKTKGTGVGLAIVKKVADVHEGKAWVESEFGHGACFKISISKALARSG